jgi:hypothetical protein
MSDDGLAGAGSDAAGGVGGSPAGSGSVSGLGGGGAGSSAGGADLGGADSGGSDTGASGGTSGGTSGGASGGDGSGGGSGGSGTPLLIVTTANDEADAGANPGSPGGTGFSLREAIVYANQDPGHHQITFDSSDMSITLGSPLPTITKTAELLGDSTSLMAAGAGTSAACISVNASDVSIDTMWIFDCPSQPVAFLDGSGSGNVMTNCYVSNNDQPGTFYGDGPTVLFNYWASSDSTAIDVYGNDAQILANQIVDPAGAGIRLRDTADDAYLLANAIIGANPGVEVDALDGARLWHNTVVDGAGDGVSLTGTTNVDFRNNIVSGANLFGVDGSNGQFTNFDYNLYFDNTSGNCSSCTPGSNDVQGSNPLFTNPGGDDYTLQTGSPAIDTGIDLGDDRNLTSPGLYNGAGPDRGFVEE